MIELPTTMPMQQQGNNLMAGLTGDILKKVTKNITETVSQHATEALNQGVPYGHILEQLLQMSPVAAGMKTGMALAGGGNQPPDPQNPGGGPPPGGQPPVAKKQEQAQVAPQTTDTSIIPQEQQPTQSQDGGNSILSQLLATMQKGNGQQMNMPSAFGGLIQPTAQNQNLLAEAAMKKQAMEGKTPMQIGDLQKLIAGAGAKQLEAQVVPPTQYEKGQQAAAAATYQLENAKAQMTALNQEQERATSEFNAMANSRGWLSKGLTPQKMIDQYKAKLNDIAERMDDARTNLVNIATTHPNLKQPTINSKELIGKTIGKYKVVSVK